MDKPNTLFSKTFSSAERIEYSGQITDLTKGRETAKLEIEDVVSLYDFKNRKVVIYGTNFGNVAIVEEATALGYIYSVLYDRTSPIRHMLPFRDLDTRDLLYIFGDEEHEVPNISMRVDLLISTLRDYLS